MEDDNAIAVIGVGCRFPGAENLDEFWRVLLNGEDHVIEIPPDRWDVDAFYSDDPMDPGKTVVKRAGLIQKHDMWDNKLFGISQLEAARMDPQQRYVLDCVHMAMEDGGITREDLKQTDTGVYIGVMTQDYNISVFDDLPTINNHTLTSSTMSIISARVSFVYNLLGPSMCVDTACSSSLVAIHLGAQAIKTGDCTAAICGGVNSILYPHTTIPISKAGMVSPTGKCHAFSDDADGYARGEGCGIVILKSLRQARKDGNKIWCILGTGCNQDGHTCSPITAPSGKQQTALLERIYKVYNINRNLIQYIEAHGTGTPVGDPVEVNSLGSFFSNDRDASKGDKDKKKIGSVKTNIGHLESAAGVAGLIKVLLMMHHGKIVPSLHFRIPNKNIKFQDYSLEVATRVTEWNTLSNGSRLSCINSFGFGGTNCHAIIKQLPIEENKDKENCSDAPKEDHLVVLSAPDAESLKLCLEDISRKLRTGQFSICDVSHTSTMRRDHFDYRVGFQAKTCVDLAGQCDKLAHVVNTDNTKGQFQPNLVFVFCGVGTAWNGMCKEMVIKEPVFCREVEEVSTLLFPYTGWSIAEKFRRGINVEDPLLNHLAIFTCQIALAKLWKFYGLIPDVILGQSVGEVAAAYTAGILSLPDAVKVIYHRSRVLANATGGKMIVVRNCSTDHVQVACNKLSDKINIAVFYSDKGCTISGDSDAIENIILSLVNDRSLQEKPQVNQLDLKCAYHSHHTEEASIDLEERLKDLARQNPKCPVISTVTGKLATTKDFSTAEYWRKNVRMPVMMQKAIKTAEKNGRFNIYLEIGPNPVLHTHLLNVIDSKKGTSLPSMTRNKEYATVSNTLLELYKHGCDPRWKNIVKHGRLTTIPCYSFNRAQSLFECNTRRLAMQGISNANTSHLCVERVSGKGIQFRIDISPSKTPFVYEHVVGGNIVLPGAFYPDIALEIGKHIFKTSVQNLQVSTDFVQLLPLQKEKAVSLRAVAVKDTENKVSFGVFSNADKVAHCTVSTDRIKDGPNQVNLVAVRKRSKSSQISVETYSTLKDLGLEYGTNLSLISNAERNESECLVELTLTDEIMKDSPLTNIHPAALDALVQAYGALDVDTKETKTLLPESIGRLGINKPIEKQMFGYLQIAETNAKIIMCNGLLLSKDGNVIAEVKNLRYIAGPRRMSKPSTAYTTLWRKRQNPVTKSNTAEQNTTVIVFWKKHWVHELMKNLPITDIKLLAAADKDFGKILDKILTNSDHRPKSMIFIAMAHRDTNDIDSDNVYHASLGNCSTMIRIAKSIQDHCDNLPVFVITMGTQEIFNHKARVSGVVGAELWGMVRCIVKEHPLNITLIDTHLSMEMTAPILHELMFGQKHSLREFPEFLLLHDGIYSNEFDFMDDKTSAYRSVYLEKGFQFQMKSKHPDVVNETFYTMENVRESSIHHNFAIESVYLHDSNIYLATVQSAEDNVPLWIEDAKDGFDILTFEAQGYPLDLQKKHTANKQDLYVACFPMCAQSRVTVPKDCMCKVKDIANYKPGMIMHASIIWQLKESLYVAPALIVFRSNEITILPSMLKLMLNTSNKIECQFVAIEEILNSTDTFSAGALVILSTTNTQELTGILKKCQLVRRVISLQMHLPKAVVRSTEREFPNVRHTSLDNEEMLGRKQLQRAVPEVIRWLRTHSAKLDAGSLKFGRTMDVIPKTEHKNIKIKISHGEALHSNGCYIVTGGLTGLGWEIVSFLSKSGAGLIVILSRRKPDQQQELHIKDLEHGTKSRIVHLPLDVSKPKAVEDAFEKIERNFSRFKIKGIFHGAAVLNDSLFSNMTEEKLKKVLLPKILGSWNLHNASKKHSLDFFVMHSSVTSVMGNIGQCNYGAGNAFMDSLAHFRKASGMCGQSINWGPISIGMVKENKSEKDLAMRGYISLDVPKTMASLQEAIMLDSPQVTYGVFDWNIISKELLSPSMHRVLQRFQSFITVNNAEPETSTSSLEYDLNTFESVETFVITVASNVFGIDADRITNATSFVDLGVDSMLAVTFTRHVAFGTKHKIPITTLMLPDTTIRSIAEELMEKISG